MIIGLVTAVGIAILFALARKVYFPSHWDYEDNEIVKNRRKRIYKNKM